MKKSELKEKILRKLGYPLIKIELTEDHVDDAIDEAVYEYKKWALGNSTQEVYFTQLLSSGEYLYNLPEGVIDIVDYEVEGTTSGINTLFTMENYLWNKGILDPFQFSSSSTGMISYHIALDFLNTFDRYSHSEYTFRYIPYRNQVQITPTPSGNEFEIERQDGTTFYSPGYILLRSFMLTGASIGDENWSISEWYEDAYSEKWVLKYSVALCKEQLAYIRRKFNGFSSIGNTGIDLDGDSLYSEAKEEQEKLMEELKNEYCYWGYDILLG